MRRPQFSLFTLGATVAFAGVACCALVYASDTWAVTLFSSVLLLLAFATVAAIYREGRTRAFWLGAAVFGWLYLLLIFGPFTGTGHLDQKGRLNNESELATARAARWAYYRILLRQAPPTGGGPQQPPMLIPGGTGTGMMGAGSTGSMDPLAPLLVDEPEATPENSRL